MLLLVFRLGEDQYGIRSSHIAEVVPIVSLQKIPRAPAHVAGLMNYRGTIVPIVDLRQLIYGVSCGEALSTRVVLVNYSSNGKARVLGLIAEEMTDTADIPEDLFRLPLVRVDEAPYLGGVAIYNGGMISNLLVDRLLSESLRDTLLETAQPSLVQPGR